MLTPLYNWLVIPENKTNLLISAGVLLIGLISYIIARRKLFKGERNVAKAAKLRIAGYIIILLESAVLMKVWFTNKALLANELYQNIYSTILAALAIYLVSKSLEKVFMRNAESIELRHKIRRSIMWGGIFTFISIALLVWAGSIGNISVFLGIVGAGIALSLQETLLCMAGWLLIVIKKPFDIGDRVEVTGQIGDVIDISLFQTTLLEVGNWVQAEQSTGRMLIIPNSAFYRNPTLNYTKGFPFIWNELSTVVTFESDWKEAKKIMLEQAMEESDKIETEINRQISDMQHEYAIHYDNFTPIVYTSIANQGVELTLRYLSPARQRRTTEHRISENILEEFIKHKDVDFAYPTTRIFRNNEEGKVHPRVF
jgi:small-conductance mechanosensitive channel